MVENEQNKVREDDVCLHRKALRSAPRRVSRSMQPVFACNPAAQCSLRGGPLLASRPFELLQQQQQLSLSRNNVFLESQRTRCHRVMMNGCLRFYLRGGNDSEVEKEDISIDHLTPPGSSHGSRVIARTRSETKRENKLWTLIKCWWGGGLKTSEQGRRLQVLGTKPAHWFRG